MNAFRPSWCAPVVVSAVAGTLAHAVTYLSVEQAQAVMFHDAPLTQVSVTLSKEQIRAVELASGVRVRQATVTAWRAADGGWFLIDRVLGKHEFITYAVALDASGAVRQIEILDYRETYGDEVRNVKWLAQFRGKAQGASLKLDGDIKNISGATLSCRHVADGVKRLLATYGIALKNIAG